MKTKEFTKKMKELGYDVSREDYTSVKYTEVSKTYVYYNGYAIGTKTIATISETEVKSLDFDNINYDDNQYDLAKLIVEYAETPLAEREDEKKYYVKVFKGDMGYLNVECDTSEFITSDREQDNEYKSEFTGTEIEQLKQRYDIPLDWDKVKLIEVEDEQSRY